MLASWAWLIPLLPLLGAAGILLRLLLGRGRAGEPGTARLASGCLLLAWLGLVALVVQAALHETPGQIRVATWFASGLFRFHLSFSLDALALGMAAVLIFLVWLAQYRLARLLRGEAGFHRFFLGQSLFSAGLLLTLLAGNAALAFAGWALTGLGAYLLLERDVSSSHAQGVFITNRIGDAGFILGIALAFAWVGSVEWPKINNEGPLESASPSLLALGFALAAVVRSAPMPFAARAARFGEGLSAAPALLYGVVMLHTGVFLLLRMEPLLGQSPALAAGLVVVGICAAAYGWISARAQVHGAAALMLASTTQVGVMILCIGLGLFQVATWHLLLHVAWRAYQLLAPSASSRLAGYTAAPWPSWLGRYPLLGKAAQNRFWLEDLADRLLLRPTAALGRDAGVLEEGVFCPLAGVPDPRWKAPLAGRWMVRLLRRLGRRLLAVEGLLAQPRYLLLMVMATLVVIL